MPQPESLKIISNLISLSWNYFTFSARLAITEKSIDSLSLLTSFSVPCTLSMPLFDFLALLESSRSMISIRFSIVVTLPSLGVNLIPFERKFTMT